MPKNLKNVIDDVESSENQTSVLVAKIERLTELVNKQKMVISEQESLIEDQKKKISSMFDIPEDIIELKELIGTQRAMLNEKDIELEHGKGEVAGAKKELEFNQKLITPIQEKLDESYTTIGQLKMELSEKSSELLLRTEEKKEYLKQIEQLTSQLTKLETILIDSKLGITEKTSEAKDLTSRFNEIRQKQEDLIRKIESLMEENRVANEQVRNLNSTIEVLQTFKNENAENVVYFKKLSKLMKEEPIFKTFLIIRDLKKGISMEDLRITIGAPIVLVKKFVQKFQELGLVDVKEDGKIVLKPVEIS